MNMRRLLPHQAIPWLQLDRDVKGLRLGLQLDAGWGDAPDSPSDPMPSRPSRADRASRCGWRCVGIIALEANP